MLLGNHSKKSTKEILDVFLFVKLESPIDRLAIDGDSDNEEVGFHFLNLPCFKSLGIPTVDKMNIYFI